MFFFTARHGRIAAFAALAAMPLALGAALAATPAPDPADPGAPTPALRYHGTLPAPASDPAALDWRQANDTVGQFRRGHIDLLQWEAAHPQAPSPQASRGLPTHPGSPANPSGVRP